jgi:hypothetical protein
MKRGLPKTGPVRRLWPVALVLVSLAGCEYSNASTEGIEEAPPMPSIHDLSESTWESLSTKKIYFGHQSVGNNIMDGVAKVTTQDHLPSIRIVESDDPSVLNRAVWAHSQIGKNGDPFSKIEAFKENLRKGIGDKADIAFFKFCFWDIRSFTDIGKVFRTYKETMDELKREYPNVTFVHFTVPLMSHSDSLSANIRRTFGLKVGFDEDNIKRNELSQLILKEYAGKEPVVDIALYESTLPDMTRTFFTRGTEHYYYLASAYTNDGGHLNEEARKWAAEQVLIILARAAEGKS